MTTSTVKTNTLKLLLGPIAVLLVVSTYNCISGNMMAGFFSCTFLESFVLLLRFPSHSYSLSNRVMLLLPALEVLEALEVLAVVSLWLLSEAIQCWCHVFETGGKNRRRRH
jgi:hypothetical protein